VLIFVNSVCQARDHNASGRVRHIDNRSHHLTGIRTHILPALIEQSRVEGKSSAKNSFFRDVRPCGSCKNRRFGET
jgi:hypothetical protein